ncbi:ABC transporter substrate-binding protein [Halolactibacillus alkaliphilus]|uniref:ABC transporter substrate-binding protein n=1 Tax=Halolactibacillus alkaliphilus TaxID=442899 RepID=A0A511X2J2_9BACI|nr:transporter substrate-binding domain-containing protein [Halolactibacillus alkaliphilus]GEN57154.1 ABC transporter substrate-binding protein [Halolactibacillus alkaliphilus]GGN72203.1 ABC transporter substrate-binding protein [Halolactibacillus alkaliphilus]SFO88379.1 amino acid ABC transporter substrate-binding protein, PAAT family [Halolactibacillus alkaliphilus]
MKKLLGILMLGLLFTLVACAGDDTATDLNGDSTDEDFHLVESGKLTFAASGEFKPFSYMEGTDMVGYDIAVGEAIAEKLGLEPNPKKAVFSGIVTGVSEGRYDIAVASHTITEERLEQVDFTEPYYYSGPVVWVQPGSDIETEADLEGLKIAVARGTTYIAMAEEYTDDIPQLDSDVVALQSLANGNYDAVITDDVTGNAAIDNGLEIEEAFYLGVSEQGIAVRKDNPELTQAINAALEEMKASGELEALAQEWIGVDITVEPEDTIE